MLRLGESRSDIRRRRFIHEKFRVRKGRENKKLSLRHLRDRERFCNIFVILNIVLLFLCLDGFLLPIPSSNVQGDSRVTLFHQQRRSAVSKSRKEVACVQE